MRLLPARQACRRNDGLLIVGNSHSMRSCDCAQDDGKLFFAPLRLCERSLRSNLGFAGGGALELLGDEKKLAAAVERGLGVERLGEAEELFGALQ